MMTPFLPTTKEDSKASKSAISRRPQKPTKSANGKSPKLATVANLESAAPSPTAPAPPEGATSGKDVKSVTVADLVLSLEQAVAEPVPDRDAAVPVALNYISRINSAERRIAGKVAILQYRQGVVLLQLRASEVGEHGKWGPFLEQQVSFISRRSVTNYMNLALSATEEDALRTPAMELYAKAGIASQPKTGGKFLARLQTTADNSRALYDQIWGLKKQFSAALGEVDGTRMRHNEPVAIQAGKTVSDIETAFSRAREQMDRVMEGIRISCKATFPDGYDLYMKELDEFNKDFKHKTPKDSQLVRLTRKD